MIFPHSAIIGLFRTKCTDLVLWNSASCGRILPVHVQSIEFVLPDKGDAAIDEGLSLVRIT